MKTYEITLKEGEQHFTTSFVKDPAIEEKLIYFNAEKPLLFFNDEKRIIYAVAMRPNKLIFRKDIKGEPAHVFYSNETVEKFQENYFKFNGQNLTNVNHDKKVNDIYVFESWIVADKENDKGNTLGLSIEKGDLVQGFKVENGEVWEQCKNGNIDGLSIEAYFDNKEVENFKTNYMTKLEKVTAFFKELFAEDEDYKPEELKEEEKPIEEMVEDPKPAEAPVEEDWKSKVEILMKENEDLKAEIQNMKAKQVEQETALETMKAQLPKAEFVKNTPPAPPTKKYEEMTNYEKMKFNRGKL